MTFGVFSWVTSSSDYKF